MEKIKVTVEREKPTPPPIKSVTITLTEKQAKDLLILTAGIGGGGNCGIYVAYSLTSLTPKEVTEMRDRTISPIYYSLLESM